jgi:hypothetical protein
MPKTEARCIAASGRIIPSRPSCRVVSEALHAAQDAVEVTLDGGTLVLDAGIGALRERSMRALMASISWGANAAGAHQAAVAICGKVNHDWLNSPRQRCPLLFVVLGRGGSKLFSKILPG